MLVAIEKIEYTPEGAEDQAVVLLPGSPIPDDFRPADLEELTKWGAIGEPGLLAAKRALEQAERDAAHARAQAELADQQLADARLVHAQDGGAGADARG